MAIHFKPIKKQLEGKSGPERDNQFRYINTQAAKFIDEGDPVISVDAKKKRTLAILRTQAGLGGKKATQNR